MMMMSLLIKQKFQSLENPSKLVKPHRIM